MFIVHPNVSSKLLEASTPLPSPTRTNTQEIQKEECGKLHTSTGKIVTFHEGATLSLEEFNQVRNITLNKSHFTPANNCAIQICGFTSLGVLQKEGYIGVT